MLATPKKTGKIRSDFPWGYRNTCASRDLRGAQVFLFRVIAQDCI
jgi:hypothetical protein